MTRPTTGGRWRRDPKTGAVSKAAARTPAPVVQERVATSVELPAADPAPAPAPKPKGKN